MFFLSRLNALVSPPPVSRRAVLASAEFRLSRITSRPLRPFPPISARFRFSLSQIYSVKEKNRSIFPPLGRELLSPPLLLISVPNKCLFFPIFLPGRSEARNGSTSLVLLSLYAFASISPPLPTRKAQTLQFHPSSLNPTTSRIIFRVPDCLLSLVPLFFPFPPRPDGPDRAAFSYGNLLCVSWTFRHHPSPLS